MFTEDQKTLINNQMDEVIGKCTESINTYGLNDEATCGAIEVIEDAQKIKTILETLPNTIDDPCSKTKRFIISKDSTYAIPMIVTKRLQDASGEYGDEYMDITNRGIIDQFVEVATEEDVTEHGLTVLEIPNNYDHLLVSTYDDRDKDNILIIGKDLRYINVDDTLSYLDIIVPFKFQT